MRAWKAVLVAALALASGAATAQQYPTKPISLLIPFPPGGSADVMARLVGTKLSEAWGQPVVVESKPGAGGIIASAQLAKSAPDGYTLMMATANVTINPSLYKSLPFDTEKAFAPIIQAISVPNVFVVRSNLPAKDLREFIALAKAQPGKLNYGGAGNGTFPHLIVELFKDHVGIDVVNVPFKGNAPALIAILRGDVDLLATNISDALPHLKSGKLRALAVTSEQRLPSLPDVPTMQQAGVPGFHAIGWMGFFAPAGTPAPIVRQLNGKIGEVLRTPEMASFLEKQGFGVIAGSPEQFQAFLKEDLERWARAVKVSGAKAE